jgi:hypothetical protein
MLKRFNSIKQMFIFIKRKKKHFKKMKKTRFSETPELNAKRTKTEANRIKNEKKNSPKKFRILNFF